MRFIDGGPQIPDALLRARDEGRVVFFCGAGVSRARAGLEDFFGLAESVIRELGAAEDCDAYKVLRKAWEIGDELDVTGLISADRVFSLLEREFTTRDIQSAVAKSLAPAAEVDRSAHEILLRLARTPGGKTQLVTTNFDRLFESEAAGIPLFQPPRLPQPSRHDDLDGIVYLHGRVDAEYSGAEGNGFVLSSADFGHAYLSEGWATEFFREIVREYVVVFVGYSADDPPVHYLLEGLRRDPGSLHGIYAFQSDGSAELTARWKHKGVEAIAYSDADRHHALWETLEHWATRADDPAIWQQAVLNKAMAGPRDLKPHERGQVAHIVSTYEGARAFAEAAPPAEWLCVFDPRCRYERPGQVDYMNPDSPTIDPFALYGLDVDEVPQRSGDDSFSHRRTPPTDAWDAFANSELDQQNLSPHNLPAVRGESARNVPTLPSRLSCFGSWIGNVAGQPAAIWWAARQDSLHPSYRWMIEWRLSRTHEGIDVRVHKVWTYLLETWNHPPADSRRDWFDLKSDLEQNGWSLGGVRRFVALCKPSLKLGPGLMSRQVPPKPDEEYRESELARVEVECPVPPEDAEIPAEWLHHVVRGLRTCLDAAARLCIEVNDYHGHHISPIEEDDRQDLSGYERTHGFSGFVIGFATLFERMVSEDERRAKEEFLAWPQDDEIAFARLRFWASGKPEVAAPDEFAQVILTLSDEVFWSSYHQRDLLVVLAKRWSELPDELRSEIESRILGGPSRYDGEEDDSFTERVAWSVLERLQWLARNACQFSFDLDSEIASRRPDAPNWKPEFAEHAADSREMRGGCVATDTEHSALLREPITSILAKAIELSGRSTSNHLMEHDPFAGLCSERPKRAYLALAYAARRNECPEWAWRTFLNSDSRESDSAAFSAVIATRLSRFPDESLAVLLYPATWWLQKVSKSLSAGFPDAFDRVMGRLTDVIAASPDIATSAVGHSARARDWVMEAINSPVGHLVRAAFDHSRYHVAATVHLGLGPIEKCLALSGDPRRHAIAMATHHLGWLHVYAGVWTEKNLLTILDGDDAEDQEAFWAGFFWNPRVSSPGLFLRIKNGLLAVAKNGTHSREGHYQSLAYLLLTGWTSSAENEGRRWVDNAELRDVLLQGGDELRSHVLWQFERVLRDGDVNKREEWQNRAYEFFEEVWPRQRSVKTPEMTARIVDVLVAHSDGFGKLINLVSPLLTTIRDATSLHIHFRGKVKHVIEAHPERFLHLLHIVLPDDVRYWPYGINDALSMIADADEALLSDTRLRELRRKWDAR
ncbi:MAG: SIR2 family protein [Fuerstiella sp.]